MNFKQIIHPEIIFGNRGDPKLRSSYKTVLSYLEERILPASEVPIYIIKLLSNNSPLKNAFLMYKLVLLNPTKFKMFHINKDFLEALSEIDKDIPIQKIPEEFLSYISFPPNIITISSKPIQGVYVSIKNGELRCTIMYDQVQSFWGLSLSKSGAMNIPIDEKLKSFFEVFKEINEKSKKELSDYENDDFEINKVNDKDINFFIRVLINSILYIHSQDPQIQRIQPSKQFTHKQLSQIRKTNGIINQCTFPITFINYGFKKPKEYLVDSTWRKPHFRWQACGPEWSQHKLIWIDEQTIHYQNVRRGSTQVDPS